MIKKQKKTLTKHDSKISLLGFVIVTFVAGTFAFVIYTLLLTKTLVDFPNLPKSTSVQKVDNAVTGTEKLEEAKAQPVQKQKPTPSQALSMEQRLIQAGYTQSEKAPTFYSYYKEVTYHLSSDDRKALSGTALEDAGTIVAGLSKHYEVDINNYRGSNISAGEPGIRYCDCEKPEEECGEDAWIIYEGRKPSGCNEDSKMPFGFKNYDPFYTLPATSSEFVQELVQKSHF